MRRKQRRSLTFITIAAVVVIVGGWWLWPRGEDGPVAEANGEVSAPVALMAEPAESDVPEAVISDAPPTLTRDEVLAPIGAAEPGARTTTDSKPDATPDNSADVVAAPTLPDGLSDESASGESGGEKLSGNPRINASLERYKSGQVIAARSELNRMLIISRDRAEQAELRRHLRKIADATVFAKQRRKDDPLMETYSVEPGDVLVNIGKQFNVPYEAIMMINKTNDRIHPKQRLKVPRGPFHAKIVKSEFRLDVYLGDLYLRSFPVALGADQGTPEGKWTVKERLSNPTYYPSASAEIKRIIPPGDPANPLGEHWIGLEGVEGDALDCYGYGIHGTIEPESIGKAVSLGCVRMHNKDVAFLYKLMMPGQSTVTTLP